MSHPGQPYHYPSAPQIGPHEQVRRRRSRWLTVGLPVGVLLLVLIGVGAVVLVRAVSGAVAPVQDAATRYTDALVDGRWADAHDQLCTADRSQVTSAELAAHYGAPPLTGARIVGVQVENTNGEQSGSAQLVLTTGDGLNTQTTLWMAHEDGVWRPCP